MKKHFKILTTILALMLIVFTTVSAKAYDTKLIREYTNRSVSGKSYPKGEPRVAFLTFDDGPSKNTEAVLDILKAENVKATFFVLPGNINKNNEHIIKRIVAEGHSIGIHTFTHDYKYLYPGRVADVNQFEYEYNLSLEKLRSVLGKDFDTKVFRYPGGHMSWKGMDKVDKMFQKKGVEWIDWNASTGDASKKGVRPETVEGTVAFLSKTINQNKNNNCVVILMHDAAAKKLTVEALPSVIKHLKTYYYNFGTLK